MTRKSWLPCLFLATSVQASPDKLMLNPYWQGKFINNKTWTNNNWHLRRSLPHWGKNNIKVMTSAPDDRSPKGDNYLRILFPAGSANSAASPPLPLGGAQFYGEMIKTSVPVVLSYYVRFPHNFPFTSPRRGATVGKLPGLFGGIGNIGRNVPTGTDGWTTRFTWCDYVEETKQPVIGGGQILQFTYLSDSNVFGHNYGTKLGCNSWSFLADDKWHNIQQAIHLNDVGKENGQIDVCVDGKHVFSGKNITFRTTEKIQINGILFQTFFGGKGPSYATPIDTYIDFADFALYLYPPAMPPGLCVATEVA